MTSDFMCNAYLEWRHDLWGLVGLEGDVPELPDLSVQRQRCASDPSSFADHRAEVLVEQRSPFVSPLVNSAVQTHG